MAEESFAVCPQCGCTFEVRSDRKTFCSRSCYRAPNRVRIEGDIAYLELLDKERNFVAETIIDAADVPLAKSYGRCYLTTRRDGQEHRVQVRSNGRKTVLPRLLIQPPDSMQVDHINGNPLDNRRSNLRVLTNSQNLQNRKGSTRVSASGIRNVYWDKNDKIWKVILGVNGKYIHVGRFHNLEEAEQAAIAARRKHMPFSTK